MRPTPSPRQRASNRAVHNGMKQAPLATLLDSSVSVTSKLESAMIVNVHCSRQDIGIATGSRVAMVPGGIDGVDTATVPPALKAIRVVDAGASPIPSLATDTSSRL